MRWAAYLHPLAMTGVLALGLFVLREGLRLRRARLVGSIHSNLRHRQLARVFLVLVCVGYASGPASLYFLRGESPFGSLHALLSSVALAGFAAAGILGLRLERGAGGRIRPLHALCGGLGLLVALATAVAGFAILP